jgi:hypothetical protein
MKFHCTCFHVKKVKLLTILELNVKLGLMIMVAFHYNHCHVSTVKPVYNGHHWDYKIVALVHRWPLFRGFSIKIAIKFDLAWA